MDLDMQRPAYGRRAGFENQLSLEHCFRLMSVYEYEGQPKFWIITEADRSATTILLPGEY